MISAKTPHVLWSAADGALLDGYDNTNQLWVDRELALGVVFPGMVSDPKQLRMRSSCGMSGSPEILSNLRLYLTGDPAAVGPVQNQWPPDGGVEISFDAGVTWIRFTAAVGNEADPATWAPVPGEAVSSMAPDGQLGPYDTAAFLVRLTVPPNAAVTGLERIQFGVDFEVL